MFSMQQTLVLLALISSAFTSVIPRTSTNPEVVYLVNCNYDGATGNFDGKAWASRMAYFSDWSVSRHNQLPQALATVDFNDRIVWESGTAQSPIAGTFPDGNVFSVWGLIHSGIPGSPTGEGANHQTTFACYEETEKILYSRPGGEFCYAIYSCSHQPHNILTETKITVSAMTDTILRGLDPVTALQHFYDDLDPSGLGCKGNSYDLGAGYSIRFPTCRFLDSAAANTVGTFLTSVVAKGVVTAPALSIAKWWSWPRTADLTIYMSPESDPTATLIHGNFSWDIIPPTPRTLCDNHACDIFVARMTIAGGKATCNYCT